MKLNKNWNILENSKKLYANGAFHIIVGTFITKFTSLFGTIFLIRLLTKNDFGNLSYLENIYGYLYLFAGMGLSYSTIRFLLKANSIEAKEALYYHILKKSSFINIGIVFIAVFSILLIPNLAQLSELKYLAIILLFSLPFQYIVDINHLTNRAMLANKRYAFTIVLVALFYVGIKIVLTNTLGLNGSILANLVVYIVLSIILTVVNHKSFFKSKVVQSYSISLKTKKDIFSYSMQFMVTNGLWLMFYLNDIFFLGLFGSNLVIADYKAAYIIPANLSIISVSIGVFISPYFIKNENNHIWIRTNFTKLILFISILMFIISFIIWIFAHTIISILYGETYLDSVNLMRLIIIGMFINSSMRYTISNLLSAMGHVRSNLVVSITGVISQIFLLILVVPKYSVIGLILVDIIVYFGMTVALFTIFIVKYFKQKGVIKNVN